MLPSDNFSQRHGTLSPLLMPFLAFSYKDLLVGGKFSVDLLNTCILDVAKALANITAMGSINPVIKATILL
jgi:hypothetical protein